MDVEVHSSFSGRWVPGFTVVAVEGPEQAPLVRLRRSSDATEIPGAIPAERVRPAGGIAPAALGRPGTRYAG